MSSLTNDIAADPNIRAALAEQDPYYYEFSSYLRSNILRYNTKTYLTTASNDDFGRIAA